MRKVIITLLVLLFTFSSGFAMTVAGVTIPAISQVGNEKLVLNGVGIRKATWFKVKVYVGALYVAERSNNADSILKSGSAKFLTMQFVRDVSAQKLRNGWSEAFGNALRDDGPLKKQLQPKIEQFNSHMPDIKDGERIELTFHSDRVEFVITKQKPVVIKGKHFSRALLSVWFINALDEGLRDGLLGK
ncbi:MAG: hypothetical protein HN353_06355 [Bdellovibrionales bacterium]|jgi:hypothetical protein|nr:hypothetical protein [Bdellovibrionales bacterium]MBT3526255.1 hypothetical protein [Bdellovibrionales bacterium]MBT7670481.1 hypothetical protein [Bdellovibrionales bacterium]MBT7766691.1 hypothetical protein [Bdellovibrionales bacterium]